MINSDICIWFVPDMTISPQLTGYKVYYMYSYSTLSQAAAGPRNINKCWFQNFEILQSNNITLRNVGKCSRLRSISVFPLNCFQKAYYAFLFHHAQSASLKLHECTGSLTPQTNMPENYLLSPECIQADILGKMTEDDSCRITGQTWEKWQIICTHFFWDMVS